MCSSVFSHMRTGSSTTGTDYFVSHDYGATWETLPHPIPYTVEYSHGYSSPMALSADGKLLFVLNNDTDPNGVTPAEGRDPRARIEFALVELETGAASLPGNLPPASTSDEPDTAPAAPTAPTAVQTDKPATDVAVTAGSPAVTADAATTAGDESKKVLSLSATNPVAAAPATLAAIALNNGRDTAAMPAALTVISAILIFVGCASFIVIRLRHAYKKERENKNSL